MAFSRSLFLLVASATLSATALAQVGNNTAVLNPNTADQSALLEVPHIDSALASAIVAGRPFLDMAALDALLARSLNEAERGEVYVELFVPINLNTASSDEIMLVPGMSSRMVHEFEEYRPYTALTQFRREIGKYVDDDEVARFEQYVFVPLDLNSATREDFLTIPGVGQRMVREFFEYRPYTSMEQFRREIGKYVDDGEVARLERYMTIR
jgi:DNA uptake protein ComE-like DNA-binding protein